MTNQEISISTLRKRIIKKRGIVPPKLEVDVTEHEEDWLHQEIPMTPKMQYIELKYNVKLRIDIFKGSLNDVGSRYNWEVDRSTISRWRKHISQYIMSLPKEE